MAQSAIRQHEGFDYVKFTVDSALLRELGERLVGKPHVALGELVKNAFDADAGRCVISFEHDKIVVTDNGNGMNLEEFVGKWMRIGSTHKRTERISPRYMRTLTGSKGIGRLAAQFLGSSIAVRSVARREPDGGLDARVDWDDTYKHDSIVEAGAWVKKRSVGEEYLPYGFAHGTTIVIGGLKDTWTPEMLRDLAAELWFLQPPPKLAKHLERAERFRVELKGVDAPVLEEFAEQTTAALDNWIAKIRGTIRDGRNTGKAKIKITFGDDEVYEASYKLPNRSLDEASFEILVFRLSGRQGAGISVHDARDYFRKFGGVHIYDSGFRLPFYGGEEQDWLGIEIAHSHRLIQSQLVPEELRSKHGTLNDLPTLGRVFGVVSVSTSHETEVAGAKVKPSDLLAVQITRDRLIDNLAFADLVHFVRWAFDYYSYCSTNRRARDAANVLAMATERYEETFDVVRQRALELRAKVPPKLVQPLEDALERFQEAESERKRQADAERVLLGALATAGMGSVALQHQLAKELANLEEIILELEGHGDNPELTATVQSLKTWHDLASQNRKMFAPFFDAEDLERMKRMKVKGVVGGLASNLAPLLRDIKVEVNDIPDDIRLPKGTYAGWNAVFQNIFVNAVNATLDAPAKRIRCRASKTEGGKVRLIVEDTGVGVDVESSEELFRPFVRKLKLPTDRKELGLGGTGIGLTIVRMVCRTFGCAVNFVKARPPFATAIEISWEESARG